MRVGRSLLAATTAAAAATAAMVVALPASARPAPVCGLPGGHTLAASRQVRIYTEPTPATRAVSGRAVVLACSRSEVRRSQQITLGYTRNCIDSTLVQQLALAGSVVAYAVERCGIDTGSTQLVVLRVPHDQTLATVPAGDSPGPESYTTVDSLVVRPDGAAAWIATSDSLGRNRALTQLWKVESGTATVLDSGVAIVVRSLRLRGRRVVWQDRGQRSATLR